MPKIVDHGQRRAEIAAALYRVIARDGMERATVREVAAEAGWSMGAVRYYFTSQDELIAFGAMQQLEQIPARLQQIALELEPGIERAEGLLTEMLALDEHRLAEGRVWLALLARAQVDDQLDDFRRTGWSGERYMCRAVICDLISRPWPGQDGDPEIVDPTVLPLEPDLEAEAAALHIYLDGLTLAGAAYADQWRPAEIRSLLGSYLRQLAARLPNTIN